jgi:general secretion pathway protein G
MMIAALLIGQLLVAVVYGGAQDAVSHGNEKMKERARADIEVLATQLKIYQAMNGFLPTTKQGLQALVSKPNTDPKPPMWLQLMGAVPLDPWWEPYQYECPGKHNPKSFDLYSMGQDRKPGTADAIGNWPKATPSPATSRAK